VFSVGTSDEQRLVKRLRNGDNAAMREFYALHAGHLTSVCSRYIVAEEDVKDVLQDAIVQIITHIQDFHYRGAGSLRAWATRIVVNQSLNFLRQAKRMEMTSLDGDIAEEIETDDPPIHDIPPDMIHQMVSQLPTGYRTVFNLYVFENKSHREIAQLLDIQEKSSASQLCRAKNLLARMIQQYHRQTQSLR